MALTFGSLFAGIGGFDRGLEACGMDCKWQVEIDDYATKVLSKHWPNVQKFRDVRKFPPGPESPWLSGEWARLFRVDGICAGFPCQDISYAGTGAGLSGARSGLFFEVIRVVQELRPKFVILENVAALLTRGLDRVLGTLASIGFDAEWHIVPACSVGAPHIRERIFIIAYAQCLGRHAWSGVSGDEKETRRGWCESQRGDQVLADSDSSRLQGMRTERKSEGWEDPNGYIRSRRLGLRRNAEFWAVEPRICRVASGVPNRIHRLKCLGNAIVPQVAEVAGQIVVDFFESIKTT